MGLIKALILVIFFQILMIHCCSSENLTYMRLRRRGNEASKETCLSLEKHRGCSKKDAVGRYEAGVANQVIESHANSGVESQPRNLRLDLNEDDPLAEFDMFVESDNAGAVVNTSKLDFYLEEKHSPRTPDFDVLSWWKINGGKFPTLQRIARDVLAIPVSTVPCESKFSIGARVISQHRSRLHSTTIEALMCSQSWLWNEIIDSTGCEGSPFPPRVCDQENDVEAMSTP